ncbi:10068_t:CDS:2 [Dentiscutata erythropus]|uniref:10068_t:CDS:1 n=1 Tax=Dentiscutata erythropus TaxID=1348616 RepID=A0A9N9GGX0_9GLOM|nr:10068_t:CDS:2 [Dentiscutata erythropus]
MACENNKVPIHIFLDRSSNASFKLFNSLTPSTTSSFKVFELLTKKGTYFISPITIPPVEQDNVFKPFEELEHYTFQLKTQLGGLVKKNVENLNFISNSSSNSSSVLAAEKISIEIFQLLALNYICKELSLHFLNFNFSLLVCYKELTLKSETSISLNRTVNSLDTITQYNRIVSPFIPTPGENPLMIILESDLDKSTDSNFEYIYKVRRQVKIEKEKLKSPLAKCLYDLARNAYLYEEEAKPDLYEKKLVEEILSI